MNSALDRRLQRLEAPEDEPVLDLVGLLETARKRPNESILTLGQRRHDEAMRHKFEAEAPQLRALAEDEGLPRDVGELAGQILAARLRIMATDAGLPKAAHTPVDGGSQTLDADRVC